MRPFKYSKTSVVSVALQKFSEGTSVKFLAGGTNLLDLMKEDVERPAELIDITNIPLTDVRLIVTGANSGGISLGALAKNTTTANHPLVRQNFPLLTQAILAGASAQIRNMATNGGNLEDFGEHRTIAACFFYYFTFKRQELLFNMKNRRSLRHNSG